MIWVGWRQQRLETLIAAGLLAVLAAVAIPVGLHMASVYTHDGLSACAGANLQPGPCDLEVPSFMSRFNGINILFTWSTLVPALAALLFAAPFVLDLDGGTYRLLWTQSITRRRWTVTKLGLAVAGSAAVAACFLGLAMWSRGPLDHLNGRMSTSSYDAEGIVPIAYALLVLGIAVAIGAVWRRTVPALLIGFALYVVARAFVDSWLRQRLLTPVKTIWRLGGGNGPNLDHALVISQYVSTRGGKPVPGAGGITCIRTGGGLISGTRRVCAQPDLNGAHAYMTAVYQPASRFWELQGVEFAIVAGIGVLLVLFAGWWTQRRIA